MPGLIPFQFQDHAISVITHDDGAQWFIAKEVCAVLGIVNVSDAVGRLDVDEKSSIALSDALHSELKMLIISEPGLYELTRGSRKQIAKKFQRWVNHEVLPSIRKTGKYVAPAFPPSEDARLRTIERATALLRDLGHLTERDTLMFADLTRDAMRPTQKLLASGAEPSHGFSIAERVEQLGLAPSSRAQQATLYPILGKLVATEWRSRYEGQPTKEQRWVDGRMRGVAWYPHDDAAWIDTMLINYLEAFGAKAPGRRQQRKIS